LTKNRGQTTISVLNSQLFIGEKVQKRVIFALPAPALMGLAEQALSLVHAPRNHEIAWK